MASIVDPLTKEPEYEQFLDLWPTEMAAKSDILNHFQKLLNKGYDQNSIVPMIKNYMKTSVEKDSKDQTNTEVGFKNSELDSINQQSDDYKQEKESDNPWTITRDRLSSDKIPGISTTYYDFLNQKLKSNSSQENMVEKEIDHALAVSNGDPNQALELLKQRANELLRTENHSNLITNVRNALLSSKVAGDYSYFKILQSMNGDDTNEANKFIDRMLKTNNDDVQKTIDEIKKKIETDASDDIEIIKNLNIDNTPTPTEKKKSTKKKDKELACPFCNDGMINGETCEDCNGTGKYQEDPDNLDDEDDEYDLEDDHNKDDDEYDRFSRTDDEEENRDDRDVDLDSLLFKR